MVIRANAICNTCAHCEVLERRVKGKRGRCMLTGNVTGLTAKACEHYRRRDGAPCGESQHGMPRGYALGCRCDRCKAAEERRMQRYAGAKDAMRRQDERDKSKRLTRLMAYNRPEKLNIHGVGEVEI